MTAVILANGKKRAIVSDRQRVRRLIEGGWMIVAFVRFGDLLKLDDMAAAA